MQIFWWWRDGRSREAIKGLVGLSSRPDVVGERGKKKKEKNDQKRRPDFKEDWEKENQTEKNIKWSCKARAYLGHSIIRERTPRQDNRGVQRGWQGSGV